MLWYSNGTDKNAFIDPVSLTFESQNGITSGVSQGHSLNKIWTFWNHSYLSYAMDKQSDRQTDGRTDGRTDSKILPTPTKIVGVDNNSTTTSLNADKMQALLVTLATRTWNQGWKTAWETQAASAEHQDQQRSDVLVSTQTTHDSKHRRLDWCSLNQRMELVLCQEMSLQTKNTRHASMWPNLLILLLTWNNV